MSQESWEWFGQPGHFCAADYCLFHLHTHVGKRYCVSTVGEYYPLGVPSPRTSPLEGATPMGASTKHYETMVFRLEHDGEGPVNHREREVRRTDSREEAVAAHIEICKKYEARAARSSRRAG